MFEIIGSIVVPLLTIAVCLGLAYLASKYVAEKSLLGSFRGVNGRFMKVIEQVPLGQEKSIAIVKVLNQHYVVAVSNNQISILKEIEPEEAEQLDVPIAVKDPMDFKSVIEKIRKKDIS